MNENLRSMLMGTAGLSVAAIAAVLLTMMRRLVDGDPVVRERTVRRFLIGLAAQSLHFMEEDVTGFAYRFPALLGLTPWPQNFFVVFNLIWLSVWILSAIDLQRGYRFALFPVWFFAIAAIANGSRTLCWRSYLMDISPGLSPLQYLEFWVCCCG